VLGVQNSMLGRFVSGMARQPDPGLDGAPGVMTAALQRTAPTAMVWDSIYASPQDAMFVQYPAPPGTRFPGAAPFSPSATDISTLSGVQYAPASSVPLSTPAAGYWGSIKPPHVPGMVLQEQMIHSGLVCSTIPGAGAIALPAACSGYSLGAVTGGMGLQPLPNLLGVHTPSADVTRKAMPLLPGLSPSAHGLHTTAAASMQLPSPHAPTLAANMPVQHVLMHSTVQLAAAANGSLASVGTVAPMTSHMNLP